MKTFTFSLDRLLRGPVNPIIIRVYGKRQGDYSRTVHYQATATFLHQCQSPGGDGTLT